MSGPTYTERANTIIESMTKASLAGGDLPDTPAARLVVLDSIEKEMRQHPDDILVAAVMARIVELRKHYEEQGTEEYTRQIGATMMRVIRKDKRANIRACLHALDACDRMLEGLPKLQELCEQDIEQRVEESIRSLKRVGTMCEASEMAMRQQLRISFLALDPYIKTINTLVKGQKALARHTRHLATMSLVYAAAPTGASLHAAQIASATEGATDEAVEEYRRSVLGELDD